MEKLIPFYVGSSFPFTFDQHARSKLFRTPPERDREGRGTGDALKDQMETRVEFRRVKRGRDDGIRVGVSGGGK